MAAMGAGAECRPFMKRGMYIEHRFTMGKGRCKSFLQSMIPIELLLDEYLSNIISRQRKPKEIQWVIHEMKISVMVLMTPRQN